MSVLKQYDEDTATWVTVGGMGLPKTPVSFSANKGGTNQTAVVTSTDTKLTFSATSFNNGAGFSTTTSRFTAPIAGVYGVTLSVQWMYPTIADKIYATKLFVNGVYVKMLDESHTSNTNDILSIGSCFISLNAGDYVEAYVKHFSGSDMAISGAVESTSFSMCLIPDSYDASKQVIDLSSATEDYLLQVGETAVINFTSATSIPLRVKTSEGVYEIILSTPYAYASATTAPQLGLRPNGSDQGTAIRTMIWYEGDNSNTISAYRETVGLFHFGCAYKVISSTIRVTTYTNSKTLQADTSDADTSYRYTSRVRGVWEDTTTVWSSLGTLVSGIAHTGRIVINRIA